MQDDVYDSLVLFLQSALFTVLRVRGVYPEDSFHRKPVLGHRPSWWSSLREVEEYVCGLCESLRPAMRRDRLRRVLVPICEVSGDLSERYIVEFPADPQLMAACSDEEVYDSLGDALTKLEMSPALLGPNGGAGAAAAAPPRQHHSRPTWEVLVETREPRDSAREEALGARWSTHGGLPLAAGPGGVPAGAVLEPLRSVLGARGPRGEAGPVVVSVYVEDATRHRPRSPATGAAAARLAPAS
ncbi:unnamed protein product [Prorocentrum cordatum]|uniref:HORMA domain-containing protein n=1 Tax=Prorocentrum cordatum TaxID=2364126 RepID=A0ABN9XB21_9DINO|nr:unnamed protein product [Polarella glacialis]